MKNDYTRLPFRIQRKNKRLVIDLLRSIFVLFIVLFFIGMCWAGERYFKGQ